MIKGERLQKNGHLIRKTTIRSYEGLQKNLEEYSLLKSKVIRMKDYESLNTTFRVIEQIAFHFTDTSAILIPLWMMKWKHFMRS